MAAPVLDRVVAVAPMEEPPDNVTLVQIDAGVKIGAGVLLAIGKAPRLSSVMLAATLIPTTAAQHRFWETEDPNQRANQQLHFTKNVALLGGLMLASADTEGKPSLAWRARRARRTSAATAELFHRDVTDGIGALSEGVGALSGQLAERTGQLLSDAETAGASALEQARSSKTVKDARRAAKKARKRAAKRLDAASKKASKQLEHASKRASEELDRASRLGSQQLDRAGRLASDRLGRSS
jgi:uncharacterized membrane protein YphA (DoxX/SURF4 family)